MKTSLKLAIVLVVAGLAVVAVALKKKKQTHPPAPVTTAQAIPKLLDLGATKCIPCIKMSPILEELKKEYAGKLEVEFIDVWQSADAGTQYGIRLIPTQIFFDATGKELFRHEGFFGKEDILGKWKELGVDLAKRE